MKSLTGNFINVIIYMSPSWQTWKMIGKYPGRQTGEEKTAGSLKMEYESKDWREIHPKKDLHKMFLCGLLLDRAGVL